MWYNIELIEEDILGETNEKIKDLSILCSRLRVWGDQDIYRELSHLLYLLQEYKDLKLEEWYFTDFSEDGEPVGRDYKSAYEDWEFKTADEYIDGILEQEERVISAMEIDVDGLSWFKWFKRKVRSIRNSNIN